MMCAIILCYLSLLSLKISAREIDKIKLDKQLGIVFKSLNPQAGSEDRLMFGSDNADIATSIASVNALNFLTTTRKEKIFYLNAHTFFHK